MDDLSPRSKPMILENRDFLAMDMVPFNKL